MVRHIEVDEPQRDDARRNIRKKISRHDNQWTINPPTVGPSKGPIKAGMMTKFIACNSSAFGNARITVSRPTGVIIAGRHPL